MHRSEKRHLGHHRQVEALGDAGIDLHAAARALRGHPWVFGNEVESLLPPEHDGSAVECRDSKGRFLGSGIIAHFHETETTALVGEFVGDNFGRRNFAILFE